MPSIESFQPRQLGEHGKKPWGIELLVAKTPHYIGKMLFMRKGGTGALQYHERKDETFYLHSGLALIEYMNNNGELHRIHMKPGTSWHVPPRAVHRVEALEDCVLFEVSTPVFDDRVAV